MRRRGGIDLRRLPIGGRQHHHAVNRLQAPAAIDQLAGEPIEELGVRRIVSHRTEVVAGGDDAAFAFVAMICSRIGE